MDKEIKCPNCGKYFLLDDTGYTQILKQVRDYEFENEINKRLEEIVEKNNIENQIIINNLKNNINLLKNELDNQKKLSENKIVQAVDNAVVDKEKQILELRSILDKTKLDNELKITKIINEKDQIIKSKEIEVEYYKDLKTKLSTKMVGETLEEHCKNEFEKLRSIAFKDAYFEKDNEVKDGTKGDFIYRDYKDGVEIISIMFEMKNESDTTATKHKNEDFIKKLDEDRKKKGCECAVLVSMLEKDNELYNLGICDMSHKYEKMYIVRPQFFIPLISILKNSAMNNVELQKEIIKMKNEQIDIENFHKSMENFKQDFGRNYELAAKKFKTAIDEIDKSIKSLEKTKENLLKSENNLRIANDKANKLSIKSLTKDSKSLRKLFNDKGLE